MKPGPHRRRSIRLKGYDYSRPGGYFVTICTYERECSLAEITGDRMRLSEYGSIVRQAWLDLPNHYHHIQLDEFITMPNHFHGIILIMDDHVGAGGTKRDGVGAIHESPLQGTFQRRAMLLPKIIGRFKMNSARRINAIRQTPGVPVWQRNYYEHIIRTEKDLRAIQNYIINNPIQWSLDQENPLSMKPSLYR